MKIKFKNHCDLPQNIDYGPHIQIFVKKLLRWLVVCNPVYNTSIPDIKKKTLTRKFIHCQICKIFAKEIISGCWIAKVALHTTPNNYIVTEQICANILHIISIKSYILISINNLN